jgi:CheY-like chemotaxis protein
MRSLLYVEYPPWYDAGLKACLAQDGYRVRCAPGGRRALAGLRTYGPLAVLVDLVPGGEGDAARLLAELRADPALGGTPVIVIFPRCLYHAAIRLEADAHVPRPVVLDSLEEHLELAAGRLGRSARGGRCGQRS